MDKSVAMESGTLHLPRLKNIPPREKSLSFVGPAGDIEARLTLPLVDTRHHAVAAICHPHPLYGGSLDNKVTVTLARTLSAFGVPSLRFNFRGVGASAGSFASGIGETEDLLAAIRHIQTLYPNRALWLAGFSFGAYVALRATQSFAVDRLITIAPPVNLYDFRDLVPPACPWLLIQGTDDEVVPYREVAKWAARLYPAPQTVYLDGVDHYFHGKLNVLQDTITSGLSAVPQPHRRASTL